MKVAAGLALADFTLAACGGSNESADDAASAPQSQPVVASSMAAVESEPSIYDDLVEEAWGDLKPANQLMACDFYTDGTASGTLAGINMIAITLTANFDVTIDSSDQSEFDASAKEFLDSKC